MKYVRLRWTDAHDTAAGEWIDPKLVHPGCEIVTVGILVNRTPTHYVITHSVSENGDARGTFAIPRQCVVELTRLR